MSCEVNIHDQNAFDRFPIVDPRAGSTLPQEGGALRDATAEKRWYDPNTIRFVPDTIDGKTINLALPRNETDKTFLDKYWELLCQIPPEKRISSLLVYGVGSGFDLSACIYTLAPETIAGSNLTDKEWEWLQTHAPDLYESCRIKLTGGAHSLAYLDQNVYFDLISAVRGGFSSLDTQKPMADPETARGVGITSNHQALLRLFSLRQRPGDYLITNVFTKEMEEVLRTAWGKQENETLHRGFFSYQELIQLINGGRTQLFAQNGYKIVDASPYSHTNSIKQYFGDWQNSRAFTEEESVSLISCKNPGSALGIKRPDPDFPTHWIVLAQRI